MRKTQLSLFHVFIFQGCRPYSILPCEHHISGPRPACNSSLDPTPKCEHQCEDSYKVSYDSDRHYGKPIIKLKIKLKIIKKSLNLFASHYKSLKMRKSAIIWTLICDRQPVCPNKYTTVFLLVLKSGVTYHYCLKFHAVGLCFQVYLLFYI